MSRYFAKGLKVLAGTAVAGTVFTSSTFLLLTRRTTITSLPSNHIDQSPVFAKFNRRGAPVLCDIATRRLPLRALPQDIQDHVRNGSGREFTRRFCAAVWASSGFDAQRSYLERRYRRLPGREDHLWDKGDILASEYPVGTKLVDHFEVMESKDRQVTIRCGDSPLNQDVRPSDGILVLGAIYLPDSEDVEFSLKSVFWNGTMELMNQTDGIEQIRRPFPPGPLPAPVVWLHEIYSKILMETSVRSLVE